MKSAPPQQDQSALSLVVLIAEDDDGHASLIERNLQRCEIAETCHRFRDGQETLDFLLKVSKSITSVPQNPHILFLDGRMPKMSGQEVLRQIQNHRILKALPLTIVSTTDDSHELESFQALGCTHHLKKPVEINDLRHVLRQLHPDNYLYS
ncbi:response regulator [Candidatus Nitronereus thalassa]|uniref:Response regulator n=1 Tax=Candidatus Nitronereus thalassa TaxID=3020898 RepID=A0ABU3K6Q6_9BACT|nr:response regulator [Candidatus Nitronereus thalassa]MDT7042075.1 response regulator [Candidatus Nitronereus thalassa]